MFPFTTSIVLSLFLSKGGSDFGDELAAIEAERPGSYPPSPDSDVAGLDVALPWPELAPSVSGPVAPRAKVVRLELHSLLEYIMPPRPSCFCNLSEPKILFASFAIEQ